MAQAGDRVIAKKAGVKVYEQPDANTEYTFASGSPSVPTYALDEQIGTFIRSQQYSRFLWFKVKAIRKYQALIITRSNGLIPIISYENRTEEFEGWVRNTDVSVISAFVPVEEPEENVPSGQSENGSESGKENGAETDTPNDPENPSAPKSTAANTSNTDTKTKALTTIMYVMIGVVLSIAVKIIFFPSVNSQKK